MKLKIRKWKPLAIIALAPIICATLMLYARSRPAKGPFALAADFPRGALVYAQFKDLPGLLQQWDQSRLKREYLESANFKQFQHQHLALKLIERWEEFNNALGFPLDTAAISGATDAGAGIAIYDIGRLDMVFIAPVSEEKAAATRFFNAKDQFEEAVTPGGTTYYRHEFEADRGRQKQTIIFATESGRLVLATNEQLLLRTIVNLKGKSSQDRLSEDPSFKTLSSVVDPHFVTVWVDQAKLNDDYYFKHYWLLKNVAELKSIRSGMFDLELQDGRWIERRDFLANVNHSRKTSPLGATELQRLQSMIPEDVPFLKVESVRDDANVTANLIFDTLLDGRTGKKPKPKNSWSWRSYDDSNFYCAGDDESDEYDRYAYPGPEYDSFIDDPRDARITRNEEPDGNPLRSELDSQLAALMQQAVASAHPLAAVVATSPHTNAGPLYVEFRRVAVLTLQTPANLKRDMLEAAISKALASRLNVAGPTVDLKWVDHREQDQSWRQLEMPMLGWRLVYAVRERELILANSPELLISVLQSAVPKPTPTQSGSALDNLTVIRFDQRSQAFDEIVRRLDAEAIKKRQEAGSEAKEVSGDYSRSSAEFFSENVSSLLDVSSGLRRIEIRRSSSATHLHEEVEFILK